MRKLLFAALILLIGSPASAFQAERDTPDLDAFDPYTVGFVQLMFGHQPDEEHQPGRDPLLPDPRKDQDPEIPEMRAEPVERKFEPSFIASDQCGMIVLAAGLAGWIALAGAVVIVERKQAKPA